MQDVSMIEWLYFLWYHQNIAKDNAKHAHQNQTVTIETVNNQYIRVVQD